jgi:hypothetical protein
MDMRRFNEALNKINEKEDIYSVELTDDNFLDVVYSDQDKFIIFCHPQTTKCKVQSAEWVFFGKKKDSLSRPVTLAKVDISKSRAVSAMFGVKDVPTYLYITQDHYYNYTGRTEPKALVKAVDQHLYLQHDRRTLPPKPNTFPFYINSAYKSLRRLVFENTVAVTAVLAIVLYWWTSRSAAKVKQD